MKTTLSERDGNTVKLAVEVSSDELQEAFDARLRRLARDVRIPGFRPGKAPLAMVRQRAGDEMILADALDEAMGGWYQKAVAELGIEPVDSPEVELDDENQVPELGKPLKFTATVTVMPDVVLGEYKGVEATKESGEATDAEVDAQVERLRNEFAELRPVNDRPAQSGDFVTVDLHATLDGETVESLEAVDFVFELGGGRMFPEVEEQLIGMSAGEEKTFPFTLPDEFPEELGGKTVEFTAALKEIKEKVLPPLTDQWASEVSEFPTLLELRQEIRNRIKAGKESAADQLFRARAIKAVTDNAAVDLPDVVVERQAEEMLADFRRALEQQGMTLDAYMEASGLSREQILDDMKPGAANTVKTGLVLDAVAKAEGIEATDEEVSALAGQMAAVAKVDAKAFENRLRKSGRIEALREQIVRDKAADFIVKNAVPTAPEPAAEAEGPAAANEDETAQTPDEAPAEPAAELVEAAEKEAAPAGESAEASAEAAGTENEND